MLKVVEQRSEFTEALQVEEGVSVSHHELVLDLERCQMRADWRDVQHEIYVEGGL